MRGDHRTRSAPLPLTPPGSTAQAAVLTPTAAPTANVAAAASAPNASWRSPPNHQERAVNRLVTAPSRNSPSAPRVIDTTSEDDPSSSGASGSSPPRAKQANDETAAVHG